MKDLKMMLRLLRAAAKSQVMYRFDFIIGLVGTLAYNGLFLASIGIITSRFGAIGGFSAPQIVLLYAMFEIAHGLYGFFLANMASYLARLVYDGTLDVYLTRPCSVLLQLNGQKMNYTAFIDLFIGAVCFAAAASPAGVAWSPAACAMLPVFFVSGAFIEFSLSLLMNCGTVVSPNLRSLYGAYYQLVLIGQRYPLNLFSKGLQAALTFVFPLGFINYYPMLFLIGRDRGIVGCLSPAVAMVFTILAVSVFHRTLRRYSSAGS